MNFFSWSESFFSTRLCLDPSRIALSRNIVLCCLQFIKALDVTRSMLLSVRSVVHDEFTRLGLCRISVLKLSYAGRRMQTKSLFAHRTFPNELWLAAQTANWLRKQSSNGHCSQGLLSAGLVAHRKTIAMTCVHWAQTRRKSPPSLWASQCEYSLLISPFRMCWYDPFL